LRVSDIELDDMITGGVSGPIAAKGRAVAIVATISAIAPPAGAAHFIGPTALALDTGYATRALMSATAAVVLIG
jgi:hypothetical protein